MRLFRRHNAELEIGVVKTCVDDSLSRLNRSARRLSLAVEDKGRRRSEEEEREGLEFIKRARHAGAAE